MNSIDRAVEIATEAAHRVANDGPEPPSTKSCVICGKEATLTDSGWVENPYLDGHGEIDGPWWDGDEISEADECQYGFVCSNRCLSQVIYDHATDSEKTALNAVADACRTLEEYGYRAFKLVSKQTCNFTNGDQLLSSVKQFHDAIHDDSNDPPAWLNRGTAESELWSAAHRAALRLEWIGCIRDTADKECKALSDELKTTLGLKGK